MSEAASTDAPRRRGRPRQTEPSPEYLGRVEEIIETAARVFHEQGYHAGSLEDVAAELGLRKASLYHYVPSKAHLLYLIFDRAISLALDQLAELSSVGDPAARVAALLGHQIRLVADEPSLFAVFFGSRPRLDPDYERQILDKERRYFAAFAAAVAAAVEDGTFPAVDARYGAQALLGMTSWVHKWFDPERDDVDAIVRDFARLVLGARTGEGAP